jgi:ABC-2 type transport system permease protein
MIVSRYPLQFGGLVLYPLAFLTLLVFTTAATFWVSALNVRYRDVQHLVNLGLLVWFWFTPIVYSAYLVRNYFVVKHPHPAVWYGYLMNPLASIVMSFQRALYGVRPITENNVTHTVLPDVSRLWLLELLGITLVVSLILLRATWGQFFRLSGDFAEEL